MVIHSTGGFASGACDVNVCDKLKRDTDDLLSCPHYPLHGFVLEMLQFPYQALMQLLRKLLFVQ